MFLSPLQLRDLGLLLQEVSLLELCPCVVAPMGAAVTPARKMQRVEMLNEDTCENVHHFCPCACSQNTDGTFPAVRVQCGCTAMLWQRHLGKVLRDGGWVAGAEELGKGQVALGDSLSLTWAQD